MAFMYNFQINSLLDEKKYRSSVCMRVLQTFLMSISVYRGTLTIRALVMGDGVPCYGALEIVGLLLLLLLLLYFQAS